MNYYELHTVDDWRSALKDTTKNKGFMVVFKHSTRCFTSMMAWRSLKKEWSLDSNEYPFYFLDLIRHRDISRDISEKSGIQHESPQILVFKDGRVIHNESHSGIDAQEIAQVVQKHLVA